MLANAPLLDIFSTVALLMVVMVGLPHGAFDAAVAQCIGGNRSRWAMIRFACIYMMTALMVVMCWMLLPGICLAAFLLVSMIHFGWGDANAESKPIFALQAILHGGMAVFGIVNFHPEQVVAVFDMLTDGQSAIAMGVSHIALFVLPILGIFNAVLAVRYANLRLRFAELIVVTTLLWLLPPLVGFACYFCFVHTTRHMQHIWQRLKMVLPARHLFSQAIGFTLASWLLGLVAFLWLDSGNIDADILRVVFIGLAALTVPHMILIDGFFRSKKRRGV